MFFGAHADANPSDTRMELGPATFAPVSNPVWMVPRRIGEDGKSKGVLKVTGTDPLAVTVGWMLDCVKLMLAPIAAPLARILVTRRVRVVLFPGGSNGTP